MLELLSKFLVPVTLDLMFASYGLGHAHTARHVKTEDDAYVLAGKLLVFYLGRSFDQKVYNVRFGDFFIFKRHVICLVAEFTVPNLLVSDDYNFAVFVEHCLAALAQFGVTSR